ncbi:glutamate--tRNA ligase [Dinghuibacter silviterrae]|uniref:Glutamate--tRNA ligase n=1 Tax=Dinghuibacter silviterrae TaxID=1539049 RepID=A0A4R8DQG1_9BACT|nr:glutamate--tRNA ligase [Dinghuibacter silviterrae]TDW99360.1 glutamyl-tRNA synthetase [Dinghuibacter silviterrae]
MNSTPRVRVRFAPSPTGGLHLGGVRTVLFNYLFARRHGGDFVLRIEDTDQTRFVEGAEAYIQQCLEWCGLEPDESPFKGGPYGPYRQSERKPMYRAFAEQLVREGKAYYAFDTPEELDYMRSHLKTPENPSPQYDHRVRLQMRNSLSLPKEEVERLLQEGLPHVVRIRMPEHETVGFTDMIRGEVVFQTGQVDDKVLLKADGMPTYHLAVVVDDYHMKITHAFRGEEWLPSAPVHVLLWKYLGWEDAMPQWAHLPLILKPDGNGKLSKRDGDRLGFPVFAMDWTDPRTGESTKGFKELGFLPEAFVNMLAMMGWNDGSGQEIFTLLDLVARFDMDRVHKGGAKFDFDKAKWFNHEWIKFFPTDGLFDFVAPLFAAKGVTADKDYQKRVVQLVKDRCTLLTDFWDQGYFFFEDPQAYDLAAVAPKWTDKNKVFFEALSSDIRQLVDFDAVLLETAFKALATAHGIKPGELQMLFRVMLVGGKFGPPLFDIAAFLGKEGTARRIDKGIAAFSA